jgi:hypothetical protein
MTKNETGLPHSLRLPLVTGGHRSQIIGAT